MVLMKNKKGFTLIEMMVTIGIVVIVSGAMTLSVSDYVNQARAAANTASGQQDKYDEAVIAVASLKSAEPYAPAATPTPTSAPEATPTPTAPPEATPEPTATPTAAPTATPTPTAAPTPTTAPTPTAVPTPIATPTPTSSSLQASVGSINSWKDGSQTVSQIFFNLANPNSSAISGWSIQVTVPAGTTINGAYNCTASVSGTTLTITPPSWDNVIDPNETLNNIQLQLVSKKVISPVIISTTP
jgi:prepilin-type N-terminal cleavage/methylation domain-containing protein